MQVRVMDLGLGGCFILLGSEREVGETFQMQIDLQHAGLLNVSATTLYHTSHGSAITFLNLSQDSLNQIRASVASQIEPSETRSTSFVVDSSRAPNALRITFGEVWPTLEEQYVWRQQATNATILMPSTRALLDLRPLKNLPDFGALSEIVATAIRNGAWPLNRAYLTTPAVQAVVAGHLKKLVPDSLSAEVFTDEQAAENWLSALRHG